MPDLNFSVEKAGRRFRTPPSPMLNFALKITEPSRRTIHAVALRCQIRIEPTRRRYEPAEQERIAGFVRRTIALGTDACTRMLWTHASIVVPPFEGTTTVDLPVPCSYDFNLAATKYFHALERRRCAAESSVQRDHFL